MRTLRCWPAVVVGAVTLVTLVTSPGPASAASKAMSGHPPGGGGVGSSALVGRSGVGYTSRGRRNHARLSYTISGNTTTVLYPGTSSTIDLVFFNPNPRAVTIPAGAIRITLSSSRPSCPAHPNIEVVQTLTSSVTIFGGTTSTLSMLGVPRADWPVVEMKDTSRTQDACSGTTFDLRYSASPGRRRNGRPPRGTRRRSPRTQRHPDASRPHHPGTSGVALTKMGGSLARGGLYDHAGLIEGTLP